VVASFGLALLGAALGATVPAVRASSYDPVEALAYE
jgi:ABC-type lipoprotein release transport system permease subunit